MASTMSLSQSFTRTVSWNKLPQSFRSSADKIRRAVIAGQQITPLFEEEYPHARDDAYVVSAASCALVMNSGTIPIGRKIGFTNAKIWSKYEPAWGYLYDKRTLQYPKVRPNLWFPPKILNLQPRIEPEIVLCLKEVPRSGMTEPEVLSCIDWIAPAFEIVISVYKDWDFNLASAIAANTLHDHLYIGKKRYITEKDLDTLPAQLANFGIRLYRDREVLATGSGSNVLGSPLQALLRLCTMLEDQDIHPGLCPGEIIATGTLTDAMPVTHKQAWVSRLDGIDLPNLEVRTRPVPQAAQVKTVNKGDFKKVILVQSVSGAETEEKTVNKGDLKKVNSTQPVPSAETEVKMKNKGSFKRLILKP